MTLVYGLLFLSDDAADLAAVFYDELRNVSVTGNFSNKAIVKVFLYVITLLSKLNEISKDNNVS